MATWYQADGSTWFWWSWVADLGPYTGGIPVPPAIWIPDGFDEIDYVVALPHPSGDPLQFADGSYDPGEIAGAYTYRSGGGVYGTGNYPHTAYSPSAHVFVQMYSTGYPSGPTDKPPQPPEAYIASTLVVGGYGPTMTAGEWSDWQPQFDAQLTAPVDVWPIYGRFTIQGYLSTTDGGTEFSDEQTVINNWRDALQAADNSGSGVENGRTVHLPSPPFADEDTPADEFHTWNYVQSDPDFGDVAVNRMSWIVVENGPFAAGGTHTYGYAIELGWGYIGQNVTGSVNDTSLQTPPALSDLTFGTDYTTIPDDQIGPHTQGYVDFETGTASFQGWLNEIYEAQVSVHCDLPDSGGSAPDVIPLTVWWKDTDLTQLDLSTTGSVYNRPWLGYEDGTVLSHVDLPAPAGTDSFGGGYYVQTNTSLNLDLSDVPVEDFSLVIQPRWVDPSIDVPGPTVTGGASYWSTQHFNGTDAAEANYLDSKSLRPLSGVPNGVWRQPRWRYWMPGHIQFHCPPGFKPKITVTEGGWSDWQVGFVDFTTIPANRLVRNGRYVEASDTDVAALVESVQDDLKAGLGSDPDPTALISGALMGITAVSTGGSASAQGRHRYEALNIHGSSHVSDLVIPPTLGSLNHSSIPSDQVNSLTFMDVVQYEAAPTFLQWEDQAFAGWNPPLYEEMVDLSTFTEGGPWTPPTSFPLKVGYCDELTSGTLTGTLFGVPQYDGPHLTYDDITIIDSIDVDTTVSGAHAPYTGNDLLNGVNGTDLSFTLSSVPLLDFSTVVMSGYAGPDTFTVPSFDHHNMIFGVFFGLLFDTTYYPGFSLMGIGGVMRRQMSRWRYWIPAVTSVECVGGTIPLRLIQRNDGFGSTGHPRLTDKSSATMTPARVGGRNLYE